MYCHPTVQGTSLEAIVAIQFTFQKALSHLQCCNLMLYFVGLCGRQSLLCGVDGFLCRLLLQVYPVIVNPCLGVCRDVLIRLGQNVDAGVWCHLRESDLAVERNLSEANQYAGGL